jgi:DNA repair protein RecN (Recombination protein N)
VFKDDSGEQSQTRIVKLSYEERATEIAQMLSGKNITQAALQNARELLGQK